MDIDDLAQLLAETSDGLRFAGAEGGGVARLFARDGLELRVTEREGAGGADVAVALGRAPEAEALRPVLEAGCGGAGTGAAAFALDGGELVLVARLDLGAMQADDAGAAIGSLLAHAAYWRGEGFGRTAAAPPEPDAMMLRL